MSIFFDDELTNVFINTKGKMVKKQLNYWLFDKFSPLFSTLVLEMCFSNYNGLLSNEFLENIIESFGIFMPTYKVVMMDTINKEIHATEKIDLQKLADDEFDEEYVESLFIRTKNDLFLKSPEVMKRTGLKRIREYKCNNSYEIILACFKELIEHNRRINKCENCNGFFIANHGNEKFCERKSPQNEKLSCRSYVNSEKVKNSIAKLNSAQLKKRIYDCLYRRFDEDQYNKQRENDFALFNNEWQIRKTKSEKEKVQWLEKQIAKYKIKSRKDD